jgi:heme-degrading monooxygenase HmoA
MLSVMTETRVKAGHESDWDRAYHERAADAQAQPGFVALQLLAPQPADDGAERDNQRRVVVGTWRNREDWERWHATDTFKRTRSALNAATEDDGNERWFTVIEEHAATVAS